MLSIAPGSTARDRQCVWNPSHRQLQPIIAESSMSVDQSTVRHIAKLARIKVSDEEVQRLEGELSGILSWVEQLNEVDTAGVEPMTSVVEVDMKKRPDTVTDGDIPDRVIANAPQAENHFFAVPKVIE
jgi:aspartyl-tRNA(Asn)/glutamyl-tRNA(Gln) amidotransferase subunit C